MPVSRMDPMGLATITATKGLRWLDTSREINQGGIGTLGLRVKLTGTSNDGYTFVGTPTGTYDARASWLHWVFWGISTVDNGPTLTVKRRHGCPEVDGYVYTATTTWTTGIGIPYTPIYRSIMLTASITVTIYADGTTDSNYKVKDVAYPFHWGEGWWRTEDWPE